MSSIKLTYFILLFVIGCLGKNLNHKKNPTMTLPALLYQGRINGQTVMIDYSSFVTQIDQSVQFLVYTNIGGSSSGGIESFIKLSNEYDYHYMRVIYHHQTSTSDSQSSTMVFPISQSKNVVLEVQKKFPGTFHTVSVYYVGSYA